MTRPQEITVTGPLEVPVAGSTEGRARPSWEGEPKQVKERSATAPNGEQPDGNETLSSTQ